MSGRRDNGHGFGLDARRRCFIAKAREFLDRLGSYEFVGREEYEEQIEQALLILERLPTSEQSERIMNEICLTVTIACYALRAHERSQRDKEPEQGSE